MSLRTWITLHKQALAHLAQDKDIDKKENNKKNISTHIHFARHRLSCWCIFSSLDFIAHSGIKIEFHDPFYHFEQILEGAFKQNTDILHWNEFHFSASYLHTYWIGDIRDCVDILMCFGWRWKKKLCSPLRKSKLARSVEMGRNQGKAAVVLRLCKLFCLGSFMINPW